MYTTKTTSNVIIILSAIILLLPHNQFLHGANAATINLESPRRPHRPVVRVAARLPVRYNKIRTDALSDFLDDDDLFDMSKRQVTDDYGHLRFGKRGDDFDDYGHLRFGRSGEKNE